MISQTDLILFILVLARVSAFVAFFPLFSKRQLPRLVKIGLACSLSFFWFTFLKETNGLENLVVEKLGLMASLVMMLKEITIGMILAMTLGLFFLPAKVAGAFVGQELGLSLASISDPGTQDSSTLITRIFEAITILAFFGLNLHHFLIIVIHNSYDVLLGRVNLLDLPTEEIVTMHNDISDYGFMIISSLVIVFMTVTVGLAFLNKAAPTLNVFSIGMPLRIGLGIFCLIFFSPVIFGALQTYLYRVQEDIEQLLVQIGGL